MAGNIWVLAEQWRGRISEISYEVLALGREVANEWGAPLQAVLLGSNLGALAQSLGAADRVLYADHPALAEPIPEVYAAALGSLVQQHKPACLLMPLTNVTTDVATLLAAQLDVPLVNFCKDVHVVDGALHARCVLYGGKMETTVVAWGEPALLGILSGVRPAEKGRSDRPPVVEEAQVSLPAAFTVRFKKYIEPEASTVDITKQDILIAVGRGIQRRENLALAEELAEALGGAVCGSRPVIDQGWLPLARQVGKSGAIVKPKLYLAAGISGAPEHVEGMKDSALIIAINTDAGAPIFNIAHYGATADCLEVLPALLEKARAAKGMKQL